MTRPNIDAHIDSDPTRHGQLLGIKLRALVREHLGDDTVGEPVGFAPGSALMHLGAAWILLDGPASTRLGASLAWALRAGADRLHVVGEADTGVLARRAGEFAFPIEVWHAEQRTLLPAVAEPLRDPVPAPAHHDRFRAIIAAGGADPIVEHGVLVGEVRGLEVCRVVDDPDTGEPRLEIGVGAHDREAFQMLHGDTSPDASLARIAAIVATHRAPGAPPHPLNRLGAERYLRWRLVDDPSLVGATTLAPAAPPVVRRNVKDPVACVAHGLDADGGRIVVVCAAGVDLELIPDAADARLAAGAAAPDVGAGVRLVVATPSRNRVPVTDELAGWLRHSVELVSLD